MNIDAERLRQLAPFALPIAVVVGGWFFLVQPSLSASTRAGRELETLRQRLSQVQRSLAEPAPPAITDDPVAAFTRQVPIGGGVNDLTEQLARQVTRVSGRELAIENGAPIDVAVPGGPQTAGMLPDPRLALFQTPLSYSPISMSFEAPFQGVGEFLWNLRDLATAVEVRTLEVKGAAGTDGRVRVDLTMFAYARHTPAAQATTGVGVPR